MTKEGGLPMTVMEQHETNKSSSYSLADSPVPVFGLPCLSYLDHALCGLLGVITSILYYHIRTYPAVNFCEWTWFSGCVWVMLASLGLRHCSYPWQFKTSSSFAISGEIIRHISSDGSSGLNRCTGSSPRQYKEVNCICVPEWAGGNQPGLRSRQARRQLVRRHSRDGQSPPRRRQMVVQLAVAGCCQAPGPESRMDSLSSP